jgi:DinB superfamily
VEINPVFRGGFDFVSDRFLDRLEGLTDHELLWEPVAGCWTVRLTDDGHYRADQEWSLPDPAPFTTIAWRIAHIGDFLSRHPLRAVAFERGTATAPWRSPGIPPDYPHDAVTAVAYLHGAIADWKRDLAAVDEGRMAEAMGPEARPFEHGLVASFVLHIHTEFVHHAAEVAALRDLYRVRSGTGR